MGTILKQIEQNSAQKEVTINEVNNALSPAAIFGRRDSQAGLSYSYYGGRYADKDGTSKDIEDGYVTLLPNTINYVEFNIENSIMQVNQTEYTEGCVSICRCTTNNANVIDFKNDKINFLLPFGTSAEGGSGGGGGGGGDSFVSIFDYRKDTDMSFTINGGIWFENGKAVFDTIKTVAEYTNIYEINLDPNSTYRVVYDYVYNTINTLLLASTDVGPSTKTSKLLYIIKTDSTKISEVHDYRKYDILVNNSVFVSALDLTNSEKKYKFSFDFLNDLQQIGSNSTVKNAWRNIYPQLSRPSFCLLCISDDAGYWSSDEAEFVTSSDKTKAWKFQRLSSSYEIYVDDDIYVFNPDTMLWQVIDYEKWQLIIKLELELH